MASVCYVRDKQAGGNLVAHVLAGERYHKRKEGVTHKTWYLFNDFAITPIEKVSLLSDWPVFPCLKCVVPGVTEGNFWKQLKYDICFVLFCRCQEKGQKNKTDAAHIVTNVTCIVSSLYTGGEHWPMLSVSDYASAFTSCLVDITDNLQNKGLKRQLITMRIHGHDRHAQR